ncbi:MAG: alkylation response protein AidB-like acyl-CoA dehydrogenase [Candidatus Aldehydirespiratoraceae bacterium]|jgi:alkylation response protein AidB-like acyl-CoA dehydrogenase
MSPAAPTPTLDDDVRQLCEALRGMLGTVDGNDTPVFSTEWPDGWAAIAALGVTAFCVPEDRGGFGLHVPAAAATAKEFGRALHGVPFAGLATSALALGGADGPEAAEILAGLLNGNRLVAFGSCGTEGMARLVVGAGHADALVIAHLPNDRLLLFPHRAAWRAKELATFDVSRSCGEVTVDADKGIDLGPIGFAPDLFGLLLAADTVGGIERMLERTVDYARERQAFGRPIGGFQAVQHRLADHAVHARGMALTVNEAARLLAAGDDDATRMVAVAQLSVAQGATHLLHDLVQLTGGIGFTWEHGLHLFERRAHQNARLVGNPRAAASRLAQLEGWADDV